MPGFWGRFGIVKADANKGGVAGFLRCLWRNAWLLVKLNLLFVAFSLLIVTIGPATAALCKVLRDVVEGKPVHLADDFWNACVERLGSSLVCSALYAAGILIAQYAARFYYAGFSGGQALMILPLIVSAAIFLVVLFTGFYLFMPSVTPAVPLGQQLRKALVLGIARPLPNFLCLAVLSLLSWLVWSAPFLGILWHTFFGFAFMGLLTVFTCYPHLKALEIAPHAPAKKAGGESTFQDEITS